MATIKEIANAMRECDQDLRLALVEEARASARRWRGLARRLGLANDQAFALHRAATAEAAACDLGPRAAVAEALGVTVATAGEWVRGLDPNPRPRASKWDGSAAEKDEEAARVHGLLEGGMSAREVMAKMGYRTVVTVYQRRDRHLAALATGGGGGG